MGIHLIWSVAAPNFVWINFGPSWLPISTWRIELLEGWRKELLEGNVFIGVGGNESLGFFEGFFSKFRVWLEEVEIISLEERTNEAMRVSSDEFIDDGVGISVRQETDVGGDSHNIRLELSSARPSHVCTNLSFLFLGSSKIRQGFITVVVVEEDLEKTNNGACNHEQPS